MSNDNDTPETDVQPETMETTEVEDATEAASEVEEESATSEDDSSADDRPRKDKGVGKRINELTREKYEAKREAERLAAELRALREAQQQPEKKPEPTRSKPTLESCGWDPEAFAEAVAEWKIEQTLADRESKYRETQARKAAEAQAKEFQARVAELEEVSPGAWEKAITAPINYNDTVVEVIRESAVGPHIAVWLAENLEEAKAINEMGGLKAAKYLGQIEAMIEGNLKARASKPATKAPPPPPKVNGAAPATKSPEAMTMAEFVAWRKSQESGKRR